MRKLTKRKRVKRTKTKKYRGGDALANQPNRQVVQPLVNPGVVNPGVVNPAVVNPAVVNPAIQSGPIAFVKSAASSAKTSITNVGSSIASSVSNKASGVLNTINGAIWNKTQSAIKALNDPVAEAKAEHAIDEAGVLATKMADAVKAPLEKSMKNTIDSAVTASQKAGPAIVRAGIDVVEAVPGLGTVVLLADEVNQLVKIGDAGLKVAATAIEGAGDVADAVKDVLDTPSPDLTSVNTSLESTSLESTSLEPTSLQPTSLQPTSINTNVVADSTIPTEKQIGGMIRKRNGILRRIDRSVREFRRTTKNHKTKRVNFTPHNTFY